MDAYIVVVAVVGGLVLAYRLGVNEGKLEEREAWLTGGRLRTWAERGGTKR